MISGYVTFSKQNSKKKSQEKVNKFECIKYFLMSKCQKKYKLSLGKNHNKYVSNVKKD